VRADERQLQFFSILVPAGLVSSASLIEVYKSFLSVLNEVGGGGSRAERAVRAVAEGLMRVCLVDKWLW
jgi:nuclear cap-binding protein subunit 1